MKIKICFVIIFIYCFIPIICNAKTIIIDNNIYQTDTIIEKDFFTYDAVEDTLILNNANISVIRTNEDLKLILIGDNYMIKDSYNINGIEAKNIEITGDGSLTINSNVNAIKGMSLKIINTKLNVVSKEYCFVTSIGDIYIENSYIMTASDSSIFNPVDHNLYIKNSLLFVKDSELLINGFGREIFVDNSNIIISKCQKIRHTVRNIYITGDSNIYVNSTNNQVSTNCYQVEDGTIILGSNDNITYYEITDKTEKPAYLRIISKNYLNNTALEDLNQQLENLNNLELSLNEKEQELNNQQELLNNQSKDLKQQEENLNNLKISLNEKEQKLNNLEETLNNKNNDILIKNEALNDNENKFNLKQNEIIKINKEKEEEINMQLENYIIEKNKLFNMESYLNSLKENIKNKEQELLNKEQYLLIKEQELVEEESINNKDNLKVEEDKQKYGEVLEDDLLESVYEITNQRTNSLKNKIKSIFLLLISFISGGITFNFIKKWGIIHG